MADNELGMCKPIIARVHQFYCRSFCFIACLFIVLVSALEMLKKRGHLFGATCTLRSKKTRNFQFVVCAVCLFLVEAVFVSKCAT